MLTSLAGLAWVAGSRGKIERASLLLGAGAALSHELGITLFPYAQVHQDACEAAARADLGEARYRDAWERASRSTASRWSPPRSRPPRPPRRRRPPRTTPTT